MAKQEIQDRLGVVGTEEIENTRVSGLVRDHFKINCIQGSLLSKQ